MKSASKSGKSIKSVTITIEELRKLVAESAAGNVVAANEMIEAKISEKSKRLEQQRMRRHHLKELKRAKAALKEKQEKENPEASKKRGANCFSIPLNREMAKCLLWFSNRRTALRSNLERIIKELAIIGGSESTLSTMKSAVDLLLHIATEAASAANDHLHSKYRMRPTSILISRPAYPTLQIF